MNYNNPFLEKKFDINNLLENSRKIDIDIEKYLERYKNFNEKGKKFVEKIYKINEIKYFDINTNINNSFSIKKTNTTVKDREKEKNKNNGIFQNLSINTNLLNDISLMAKNGSNKILKFPKHSFASKSNSNDINNIKLNNNKRLCAKYKLIKKPDNQIINKVDYNKKLIIKNKFSNSNIHNNNNKNIITDISSKNHSPRLLNNIKNKDLNINTTETKKDKLIIQTKPYNYSKINKSLINMNYVNINSESMNTMVNKNHYQKILYKRKKNMGNIPKNNGFSSSNIKQMQKKNSSNKTTEMSDILNSAKKNLSKEMHGNNNSKENDIKVKNTIIKNKLASISILNGINKNNLENNSRNNLINELKRRKQYLNKQIKYFLTNDSSKFYNSSFFNSDKKKMINSDSNSKNNIKEKEKNNHKKYNPINKDTKPTKFIKINI